MFLFFLLTPSGLLIINYLKNWLIGNRSKNDWSRIEYFEGSVEI
ncbi:conserved hypothetical protein [delta proteobacterium NaphS2]|nr:conserved hypothetical protein [delta proteobacterium NaphS2]